jgi:hypothetical protein
MAEIGPFIGQIMGINWPSTGIILLSPASEDQKMSGKRLPLTTVGRSNEAKSDKDFWSIIGVRIGVA